MRAGGWLFALTACGGGRAAAPIANATPAPTEDLRDAIVRELGPSAYLTAGAAGLVAHGPGAAARVLVDKPVNAAAYDASLELAFVTLQDDGGVWSIDLRARTARLDAVIRSAGNGDFAIGWFDDGHVSSNSDSVNISISLETGQVVSTSPNPEGPVEASWVTRMRERTRRSVPGPVAVAEGATLSFGKTGLAITASEVGLTLRRGDRAAAIDTPTKWLAPDSDELDASCAIVELDATEQQWFAFGAICTTSGCTALGEDDRPIAWLDPGPVVRPACADIDEEP